jgi:hypothetical protein
MAVKLFNLRHVPDDEAEDIRQLLDEHGYDYYETPRGNWGISAAIIWLRDPDQLPGAKSLIDQYQVERGERVRAEYERMKQAGEAPTLLDKLIDNPLEFVLMILVIVVVAYFSIRPFINIGQ